MRKQRYKLLILLIPLMYAWMLITNTYETHKQDHKQVTGKLQVNYKQATNNPQASYKQVKTSKKEVYTLKFEKNLQKPLLNSLPTLKPTLSTLQKPTPQPTETPSKPPKLDIPISKELQNHIYKLCSKNDNMYFLMIAIMDQESDFNSNSISADGRDFGLFQIRDVNFSWLKEELNIDDCIEPFNNAKCAVHMVKKLIEKYEHYNLVLMAYNMGEYGAKNKWKQGIYSSSYSRAVLPKYEDYKKQAKEK